MTTIVSYELRKQIRQFHFYSRVQVKDLLLTLRSQVVLSNRLLGLRSRCSTLAECMYLRPRKIWYRKQQTWSLLRCWDFNSLYMSVSIKHCTIQLNSMVKEYNSFVQYLFIQSLLTIVSKVVKAFPNIDRLMLSFFSPYITVAEKNHYNLCSFPIIKFTYWPISF